jgi:hypothetical protein
LRLTVLLPGGENCREAGLRYEAIGLYFGTSIFITTQPMRYATAHNK